MKYIDADKLIAEIERVKAEKTRIYEMLPKDDLDAVLSYAQRECLQQLGYFIASIQQEQPKPSGYDKALLEVKSLVDKLYDEASIGLNEYDSGLYNGIAETCMKLRGFIKARLDSDEQPEVDLEKSRNLIRDALNGVTRLGSLCDDQTIEHAVDNLINELGLNARKEESK